MNSSNEKKNMNTNTMENPMTTNEETMKSMKNIEKPMRAVENQLHRQATPNSV